MSKITLPKEVTDAGIEFAREPDYPKAVYPKYGNGEIEFATLTVRRAQKLIRKGFPFLRMKGEADAPAAIAAESQAPAKPPADSSKKK